MRMCKIAFIGLFAALFWFGASSDALAQRTGGSMGGGSFSSGGSSGGSYSGSYSSGSSYSSSGSSSGSASGTGVVLLIVLVFAIVVIAAVSESNNTGEDMDVTVLQLALDWRARAHVQKEMNRIAEHSDTSSQSGLVRMLREVTVTLRRNRQSWLYAGASNYPIMPREDAEAVFQRAAQRARVGFEHELLRNADGALTRGEKPELLALAEEGPGVVLITLVIAARHQLVDVHTPEDAEVMRAALESLGELTAGNLVAVEIVWSPAADKDRMSTAELTGLYDVVAIRGATVLGRVYCDYCDRPYTGELLSCPHCGAGADADLEARG